METTNIAELAAKIRECRALAEEIMKDGGEIEAVRRNAKRMLTSLKMLELNVCDVQGLT